MSELPDELWRRIVEVGIKNRGLSYRDLCCISISCRRFHRLSDEDCFWSHLLSTDFPFKVSPTNTSSSSSSSSSKTLYKNRFERDRERKLATHRRAVLRKESQIAQLSKNIQQFQTRLADETLKLRATLAEFSHLSNVRQASVALNVWQPEVIRSRQKQLVEQCAVPVESRIHAVEMELRLCKQQIKGFEKACKNEKQRLDTAKEELVSMKYHPLQDYTLTSGGDNGSNIGRKKLKRCHKQNKSIGKTS